MREEACFYGIFCRDSFQRAGNLGTQKGRRGYLQKIHLACSSIQVEEPEAGRMVQEANDQSRDRGRAASIKDHARHPD